MIQQSVMVRCKCGAVICEVEGQIFIKHSSHAYIQGHLPAKVRCEHCKNIASVTEITVEQSGR